MILEIYIKYKLLYSILIHGNLKSLKIIKVEHESCPIY